MKTLTPIKAIRAKCLDCSCHQRKEVYLCPVTSCALWPYRMGKRPKKETEGTLAQAEFESCNADTEDGQEELAQVASEEVGA